MSLWIPITIAAAAMQTLRFVLQKQLSGSELSAAGATFARFLFAAPLACLAALISLRAGGQPLPRPGAGFWGFVLMGGIAQILATFLTVALFGMRNFAVGIAFTKTETVQVALFSAAILGEPVAPAGWLAIALGLIGVLFLSRSPEPGAPLFGRPAVYGVLAGGLFGLSAIGYRGATVAIDSLPFLSRALVALAAATVLQSLVMAVWLAWREPGQIRRVANGWRRTALVGLTGMLGSLGWFTAFSLQNAAIVRALGQVEIVFTLMASVLVFHERLRRREAVGIGLVIGSLIVLVATLG